MMSSCHMPPPRFQRQAKAPVLWAPATLSTVIYTHSIAVRQGLWSITGTEPGGVCFAYFVPNMPNSISKKGKSIYVVVCIDNVIYWICNKIEPCIALHAKAYASL